MRKSFSLLIFVFLTLPLTNSFGDEVRLQLKWYHQFQFAGYYAADHKGYYEDEGLSVKIVEGGPTRPPIPVVMSGECEFGVSDSDVVAARLNGKPIVALAAIFQHTPYVIMSLKKSKIRSPADLVGKTIMNADDQGAAQITAMFVKEGIDPKRIQFVKHSWDVKDLIAGKTDAMTGYAMVEPFMIRALGEEPSVLRSLDYGVDFYGDTLFTTESEIENHPERVAAFRRASLKGWQYAMDNRDEILDYIETLPTNSTRIQSRGIAKQQADGMSPYILNDIVEIGHMNEGRWKAIADAFIRLDDNLKHQPTFNPSLKGFMYDPESDTRKWLEWTFRSTIVLGIVAIAIAFWNITMRRRVKTRTTELQKEVAHRIEVEQELRQRERLLDMAGRTARLGGWSLESASNYVVWSDEVCAIHGVPINTRPTLQEAVNFYIPEHRGILVRAARHLRVSGTPFDLELQITPRNSKPIWVRSIGQAEFGEDGKVIRIHGAFQDINERKSLQEQFLRVQRLESIGTLSGGIAHDLNNVFSPIMILTQMLKEELAGTPNEELLNTILESAQRGSSMVGQLLSFARGVAGPRVVCDAANQIQGMVKLVSDTFPKNIHIETSIQEGLWPMLGDPTQVHQVLLNLCVNARDAMPDGGEIRIYAENVILDKHYADMTVDAKPGSYIRIRVEDTGKGIPKQVMNQIFDPFFSTKESGDGTGLGLSTTLGIVRSHHGFIHVYSEEGRGAQFRVYFPRTVEDKDGAEIPKETNSTRGNNEWILVIDDEEPIRRTIQSALERQGFQVMVALDGAEGLRLLAEKRVSLVITDLTMPGMDGVEFVTHAFDLNPGLPIIATSGLIPKGEGNLNLGNIKAVLQKPFTGDTLIKAIHDILNVVHT